MFLKMRNNLHPFSPPTCTPVWYGYAQLQKIPVLQKWPYFNKINVQACKELKIAAAFLREHLPGNSSYKSCKTSMAALKFTIIGTSKGTLCFTTTNNQVNGQLISHKFKVFLECKFHFKEKKVVQQVAEGRYPADNLEPNMDRERQGST